MSNPLFKQQDNSVASRIGVRAKEAAKLLGVCVKTLSNWERAGLLRGSKIGQTKLYALDDLQSLVNGHKAGEQRTGGN